MIFDEQYKGKASSAVWIVDTPANRSWYAARSRLDANSALFMLFPDESLEKAFQRVWWGIEDHFPDWEEVDVLGGDPERFAAIDLGKNAYLDTTEVPTVVKRR